MTARVLLLLALFGFLLWLIPGQSTDTQRELAVPADALIAVELATVAVVPFTGTPVVLLREPESGSIVPIFIGPTEATAIVSAQRAITTPRPMTHDLASNLIHQLGGTLERVIVDELRDGTYFGALDIRRERGGNILVDSRPSDALALAVRTGAAIFVAPDVLAAGEDIPFEGLGDDVVTALGITVMLPSRELRQALQLPDGPGVLVNAARGPAAEAGIRPGALITRVNEVAIVSPLVFLEQVNATPRGERALIEFWVDGETRSVEVDLTVPTPMPRRERRDIL
ncbi:MAG: bifunctional nuclease domain-containing protein [Wenzhouxiangella sp.]